MAQFTERMTLSTHLGHTSTSLWEERYHLPSRSRSAYFQGSNFTATPSLIEVPLRKGNPVPSRAKCICGRRLATPEGQRPWDSRAVNSRTPWPPFLRPGWSSTWSFHSWDITAGPPFSRGSHRCSPDHEVITESDWCLVFRKRPQNPSVICKSGCFVVSFSKQTLFPQLLEP